MNDGFRTAGSEPDGPAIGGFIDSRRGKRIAHFGGLEAQIRTGGCVKALH